MWSDSAIRQLRTSLIKPSVLKTDASSRLDANTAGDATSVSNDDQPMRCERPVTHLCCYGQSTDLKGLGVEPPSADPHAEGLPDTARSRFRVVDHRHLTFPFLPGVMVRDQVSHEMCDIDATGSPRIKNRAPGRRWM